MESGQTGEEKEPGITELDGETSSVRSVVVEEEEAASSRIRMPDKHVVLEKMALYQTQAVSAHRYSSRARTLTPFADSTSTSSQATRTSNVSGSSRSTASSSRRLRRDVRRDKQSTTARWTSTSRKTASSTRLPRRKTCSTRSRRGRATTSRI